MAAPSVTEVLNVALEQFKQLTQKPEKFLTIQDSDSRQLRTCTKNLYNCIKEGERKFSVKDSDALPSLIVAGFDEEQIWQQLELQNESVVGVFCVGVANVCTNTELSFRNRYKTENKTLKKCEKNDRKIFSRKELQKQSDKIINDISYDVENEITHKKKINLGSDDVCEDDDNDDVSKNNEGDDVRDEESDSEKELEEIKSRLKAVEGGVSGNSSSEEDDLDFDFGDVEMAMFSKEEGANESKSVGGNESDEGGKSDEGAEPDDNSNKRQLLPAKSSIVDDQFFKLVEMERFLDQQDALEMRKDNRSDEDENDEDIDVFQDLGSSGDEDSMGTAARDIKYKHYFQHGDSEPRQKKVAFKDTNESEDDENNVDDNNSDESNNEGDDDVADDGDNGDEDVPDNDKSDESEGEAVEDILGGNKRVQQQSTFEMRQEKLNEKISKMEDASLSKKPWQLSGEVSAFKRPENSLLEETVQFEHTTRLPPVITEETTKDLESIILQRIKDKAWDDVERKVRTEDDPREYKKRITLDQEKSKQSLSDIYEQEFLRQQQAEEVEKKDPDHESIKKSLRELFIKLDALSNSHFTPKPAAPDVVIVSNQPSINMEEVAPVHASDAQLLAPEEIHDKKKGELKGDTEKSGTDRKRDRRNKKSEKRAKLKEKETRRKLVEKLNPGLGNKYSKERAMRELEKQSKGSKSLTVIKGKSKKSMSSKVFFTQLQEEVRTEVGKRKVEKISKNSQKSVKKFKL